MRRSRRHKLITLVILFVAYYAANALTVGHNTSFTSTSTTTTTTTTSTTTPSPARQPSDDPSKETQTTYRSIEETTAIPDKESSTGNSTKEPEEAKTTETSLPLAHPTWRPKRENCTPPAIEQFPRPLMGPYGRRHGGLVIHFLVAIFTFIGLAIVCDEYFVAALDRICEELKMSPDVAGATFMAAGSSAPELATVVIGVFFAKDDIGTSGVIGSAVFNIMFVISVCALCAGTVSHLNWWPLCRDCFFYALSILLMLAIICNDVISWPEALIMLLTYVVYCVALHFNSSLERWALSLNLPFKLPTREEQAALVTYKSITKDKPAGVVKDGPGQDNYASMDGDDGAGESPEGKRSAQGYNAAGYDNAAYNADLNQGWDPNQTWGDNTQGATAEAEAPVWDPNSTWGQQPQQQQRPQPQQPTAPAIAASPTAGAPSQQLTKQPLTKDQNYYRPKEYNPDTAINPLIKPVDTNLLMLIWWYIVYPIHWTCRMTMPDCRTQKYRNWYPFTFFMSMIWISFYSYFMVWMITIIGSTLGIPDTVMGLTFVAAGVSVPDALSSLAVIKEGYGDMAVSNAVGSNVFDILVCLGLPWFIQTAIIQPGSHVNVISKGLVYTTMSLLSTVIFLILATHLNGWKLDRKYGIILMIWYLLFITFAALYELNVFGELNKPECTSLF